MEQENRKKPWQVIPDAQQKGDTHIPRYCSASCVYKNFLIIFGGVVPDKFKKEYGSRKFNEVYAFDLKTKIWKLVPTTGDVPTKRYCHSGTLLKSLFVVFGGISVGPEDVPDGGRRDDVSVYSLQLDDIPNSAVWKKMDAASPPPGRSHHAAAAYGSDKLVIFGGIADSGVRMNDVYILDIENLNWTLVSAHGEVPANRLSAQIAVWQNKVVLFGGYTGSAMGKLNDVHVLDLTSHTWNAPKMTGGPPSGRYGHTGILLGNKFIIYGGLDTQKKGGRDLYSLDLEYMEWSQLDSSEGMEGENGGGGHYYHHSAAIWNEQNAMIVYGNRVDCSVLMLKFEEIDALRYHSLEETKNTLKENIKLLRQISKQEDKNVEKLIHGSLNLLKDQFKRLGEEEHKIQNQIEELQESEKKISAAKKKMEVYLKNIPNRIKLNVGGLKYETTRATLISEQGSMLHAMFSGFYPTQVDEEGFIFIDRDGNFFSYILNYLRNGTLFLPNDRILLLNLQQEAQFFQLDGLYKLVHQQLSQLEN